jgi:hypothetical protein
MILLLILPKSMKNDQLCIFGTILMRQLNYFKIISTKRLQHPLDGYIYSWSKLSLLITKQITFVSNKMDQHIPRTSTIIETCV